MPLRAYRPLASCRLGLCALRLSRYSFLRIAPSSHSTAQQCVKRAAACMLSAVDVDNLLTSFASKHRLSASFQAFKEQWLSCSFSLIHDARPGAMCEATYTQELFAAALLALGRRAVADEEETEEVHAFDAGCLYALLLLFHSQRCRPRVQVYLPLDKATGVAQVARKAAATRHTDVLAVLRTLLADSALVVGSLGQPVTGVAAVMPETGESLRLTALAVKEHLISSLDAAREFAGDCVANTAAEYAATASACALQHDASAFRAVMHGSLEGLVAVRQEVVPLPTQLLLAGQTHAAAELQLPVARTDALDAQMLLLASPTRGEEEGFQSMPDAP